MWRAFRMSPLRRDAGRAASAGAMPATNPEEVAMTDPTPAPTDPGATPPTGTTEPAKTGDDKPLGEAGQKALAAERDARKALEKQLADQAKTLEGLAPLAELAKVLGVKAADGKTDVQQLTEQVAAMQKLQQDAEVRALRLEVAAEKGLTPAQAARLQGGTRDELAADADQLKTLFPGAAPGTPGTPGTPVPDPSQGAHGSLNDLQTQLKAAQDKGDHKASIRLKTQIAAAQAAH